MPTLESQSTSRKRRIIQVITYTQIALSLACFHPILTQNWLNLSLIIVFFSLMFVCRIFAEKSYLNLSSYLLSFILAAMILTLSFLNQGVRDEILLVFPALITFMVLMGTGRMLWWVYGLITAGVFFMGLANELAWYHHVVEGNTLLSAILIIIILTVITASTKLLASDITLANKKLRKHQEILEQEVVSRTQELTKSLEQLKRTQDDLVEAEKMASLGRLVAGVAHEINTPLGVSLTAASNALEKTHNINKVFDDKKLSSKEFCSYLNLMEKSFSMIQGNVQRAAHLVGEFKQVAVIRSDQRSIQFNLLKTIRNTIELNDSYKTNIKLNVHINGPNELILNHEPDAIIGIITNLYINSITHGFNECHNGEVLINVSLDDRFVSISYQDNGVGLSEEAQDKVFEPFYTTKRGQGGTGLGMHLVYNLVTQSLKGKIQSVPADVGARFLITFPFDHKMQKQKRASQSEKLDLLL